MAVSTADALVQAADTSAENTAKSAADKVSNPNASLTPTLDPKSFIQQSQDINSSAYNAAGIPQALTRMDASGNAAQNALNFVGEKIKQDEYAKLPLDAMNAEREKLVTAKFRILPDMLARTDITDYKSKVNLANQLISSYDTQIQQIDDQKTSLTKKADDRAALQVSSLQATASVLDKQFEKDKADLATKIDLYKTGQGNLQSILQQAVAMQENNQKRADAASTNPFVGGDANAGQNGGFNDAELAAFNYYDAYQKFPVASSVDKQTEAWLTLRYQQWAAAGKPGTSMPTEGPSYQGKPPAPVPITNPFQAGADIKNKSGSDLLTNFIQALQTGTPSK